MHGLKLRLEGIYFATFRKPTTTSLILTYTIPPYTTIRGLISNALGLHRDDLRAQEWFRIGIKPVKAVETSREMAKVLKLFSREMKFKCESCGNKWIVTSKPKKCPECNSKTFVQIPNFKENFPSSPMFREFLVNPVYDIFLAGEQSNIEKVYNALLNPARPLYFGGSDDMADVEISEPVKLKVAKATEVHSVVEGIHKDCVIEKVPYRFLKMGRKFSVEYKTVSVPRDGVVKLREAVECVEFDGENVQVV